MTIERFDCFGTGVLEGRKLIESSAGTGKTYTIASLYVRLLVEKELQVGQILVVTFTKAATEELKGRIRKNIRETLSVLEGAPAEDEFIGALHARLAEADRVNDAAELLANALRMFDEAAIFTIHGFCGRVLKDNAFESASLFDTELVTDGSDLIEEIAADFYRTRIHGQLTPFPMKYVGDPVRYFVGTGLSPGELARFIRENASKPFLSILPDRDDTEKDCRRIPAVEAGFEAAWREATAAWLNGKAEIMALLGDGRLNGNSYSTKIRARMEAEMDGIAESEPRLAAFADLDRFRPGTLALRTNKKSSPPEHPFFDLFERWFQASADLSNIYIAPVIALRHELLAYANAELDSRKKRRNIRFYDDLLQDLQIALEGSGRNALIERVRSRYFVGLIDEFQDTDLLQYEIFNAFFPEGSTLFLIGDPKQAIYSFRGADVFAYLNAAGNVEGRYSLGENFRSTPGMVRAVNALFRLVPSPFVFDRIDYPEVSASGKGKAKESTSEGVPDAAPLNFRFVARTPENSRKGEISKGWAARAIPEETASEIVSLLEDGRGGRERLDGKPVAPGDVAVLVRTNRQAREIHSALRRRGVPAVIYGSESVFCTREADDLQRLLGAIVDPGHDGKVRAALASACFGVGGNELIRLQEDESGWTGWVLRFMGWRAQWTSEGFVAMARSMMRQADIRKRILSMHDGERRLTNLLHLFELMHDTEHGERLGVEGLANWLSRRRADAGDDEEERRASAEAHQLRLETDETAVKVVTVHKSKGLEYPIVYCPYLWDVYSPRGADGEKAETRSGDLKKGVLCHGAGDDARMVRDFGSAEFAGHAEKEALEQLSENARMLYVALTRSKYRAIVVWGAFKGAGRSALGKLLHPGGLPDKDDGMTATLDRLKNDSGTIGWKRMATSPFLRYVADAASGRSFACRRFQGRIDREWGVSSFSALVSGAGGKADRPDRDELSHVPSEPADASVEAAVSAKRTPFDFPRGAKSGLFFHALMESLDFAAGDDAILEAAKARLPEFGLGPEWDVAASTMAKNALHTPLDPDDPGFVLAGIGSSDRRHEVEFGLSLGKLTPDSLRGVFAGSSPADHAGLERMIRELSFSPVRGLLKGYIDMVFTRNGRHYLLDWKTNHLGMRVEDYGGEALGRSMEESYYFLQSLLYTVALDRYLAGRVRGYDYDTHFGGVYYLYVRGMDPSKGPGFGVHHNRPAEALVRALGRRLKEGA